MTTFNIGIHVGGYSGFRHDEDGKHEHWFETFEIAASSPRGDTWVLIGSRTADEAEAKDFLTFFPGTPETHPDLWAAGRADLRFGGLGARGRIQLGLLRSRLLQRTATEMVKGKIMYAWIVTKDKVTTPDEHAAYKATNGERGLRTRKGWVGPRDAPDDLVARLKAGEGLKWRCRDDDDNIYYYGRVIEADAAADANVMSEEALMGPLNDLAAPDAGACKIEHYDAAKKAWEYVIG